MSDYSNVRWLSNHRFIGDCPSNSPCILEFLEVIWLGDCSQSCPWNLKLQKSFLGDTKDYCHWVFAPQVPYEILIFWNISWGDLIGALLLELPTISLNVEIFFWGRIDFLSSSPWMGFQLIGVMHCILPTKIIIVCLTQLAKHSLSPQ